MSDDSRIIVVEDESIVGRIHAMLADLHRHGRMSCAEVALIHALTQNPDLPDEFRMMYSGPLMRHPVSGGGDQLPVLTGKIDEAIDQVSELAELLQRACTVRV